MRLNGDDNTRFEEAFDKAAGELLDGAGPYAYGPFASDEVELRELEPWEERWIETTIRQALPIFGRKLPPKGRTVRVNYDRLFVAIAYLLLEVEAGITKTDRVPWSGTGSECKLLGRLEAAGLGKLKNGRFVPTLGHLQQ